MRARAVLAVSLALPLTACSVLFGLDGYAGSGEGGMDGARDGSLDTSRHDATADARVEAARDARRESSTDTSAADARDAATDSASDAGTDCAAPPPPTAYWKIDEGMGSTVHDSTGHGNTGTFAGGTPTWVAGVLDGQAALSFDGVTNEYVDFQNPPDLHLTGSMTVSAWVNLGAGAFAEGGFDQPILSKRAPGNRGWQLYFSDGDFAFDVAHQPNVYAPLYASGPSLSPGVWYHVVGVYQDGSSPSLSFYVDGAPAGTQALDAGLYFTQYDPSEPVHLGNSSACTVDAGCPILQLLDGLVAEVRVYSAALSACQVAALP